ncbi:FimD/PapC N-terminal domain-containing protein, partial [Escherichia coli]
SGSAFAKKKYEFDPSLINSLDGKVSIDVLNQDSFPSGEYIVDIFLNGDYGLTQPVTFIKNNDGNNENVPCLDYKLLLTLGVKKELIKSSDKCVNNNNERWNITHNLY